MIAGGVPTASAPDGKKSMHVVFVDNGRKAVLNDPILSQALRCVRCGAAATCAPCTVSWAGTAWLHLHRGHASA